MIWHKLQKIMKFAFSGNMLIAWMMLASILPMLLVVYFLYTYAKTTLLQTIDRDISVAMKEKVGLFDNYIAERKLDLIQLARLPSLLNYVEKATTTGHNPMDEDLLRGYLKYITPKLGIDNIYMIDLEGKIIFALNPSDYNAGTVLTDKPPKSALYDAFIGAKIMQISFVQCEISKDHTDIYLSGIVIGDGKMKAVLVTHLSLSAIQRMINKSVGFSKSESTFLGAMIDGKPTIVMQSNIAEEVPLDETALNYLSYSIRGGTGYPNWDKKNNSLVIASDYVPQLNMGLLLRYDETEIYEKAAWYRVRVLFLTGISVFIVFIIVFWVSRSLRHVMRKNETLLASILPQFVIEELNEKKRFAARNIDMVSVIFIDIVNFTSYASTLAPADVVETLDNIFSLLDSLCDKYQLEKIKTIGDAHMSVSGLIQFQTDHAERAIDMALEAIISVKHYNLDHGSDFSLRVGIDSGTITAGITGRKKPSYDIWGHVVNRASRMESTGLPNQVQITEATYSAIVHPEAYKITKRTGVSIKGLGEMDTYLVSK
jgi:class 3 adenylate cyclase